MTTIQKIETTVSRVQDAINALEHAMEVYLMKETCERVSKDVALGRVMDALDRVIQQCAGAKCALWPEEEITVTVAGGEVVGVVGRRVA